MNILEALILGIVQGISEFLPVSSSGHLSIFSEFLNLNDVPILFDILLHIATLASVLIVFRKRIGSLFVSLFKFTAWHMKRINKKPVETGKGQEEASGNAPDEGTMTDMRMILALIIATAGTGITGFIFKDFAENMRPVFISCLFIATGIILVLSGRMNQDKALETVNLRQALIIGLAQGIGVLPGLSRSGVTISTALFTGVKRTSAGEFSFLLSIPAIIAAFIFELKDADTLSGTVPVLSLITGMMAAFIAGLVSLKLLLRLINRGKLGWFACYLIPAGIILAAYFLFH